ncbi:MAG: hypothetical protein U0361_15890 [Nitrospiraceae bacterium]
MKRTKKFLWGVLTGLLCGMCVAYVFAGESPARAKGSKASAAASAERHLKNVRQLTFGRQNAEAYFSFAGNKLIFQSTNNWMKDTYAAALKPADEPLGCYQMYIMDLDSDKIGWSALGSNHDLRFTFPGITPGAVFVHALRGPNCPPKPKRDGAYRWALDDYDLLFRPHRWAGSHAVDEHARIRCRGHGVAGRQDHRLDLRARRGQPGYLCDGFGQEASASG